MRDHLLRIAPAGVTAIVLILVSAARLGADDARGGMEYAIDFRTEGFDNLSLQPFGQGSTSLLRQTENGVLISVPAGTDIKKVGFAPRFVISGDFEITVAYRVLAWPRPDEGASAGPTLYIATEEDNPAAAELGRLRRHGDTDIHSTFARAIVDGAQVKGSQHFPTQTQEGQLRLRRENATLSFEVREDLQEGTFEVLRTGEFNDSDVILVRVGAQRDDPRMPVELAITSFRVRADDLPHLPAKLGTDEALYRPMYHPPSRTTSWVSLAIFAGGLGALLAAVLGVLWWRKSRL